MSGTMIEDVSPRDVMHRSDPGRYFVVGGDALEAITRFIAFVGLPEPRSILDLPCGHGRVLRFLRARFPEASIAASDVDTDGVDFCASTFGARPVYSTPDLAQVPLEGDFDLIWCGSLMTHVHADQWRALLQVFADHMSRPGLLIFTTHGRFHAGRVRSGQTRLGLSEWAAKALLSDYDQAGFGFQSYSGQEGYGISLSSSSWVCSQVLATKGLRIAGYHERGWSDHQDVVACVKDTREVG
jgi:SAM-dependent methyltransferase